MANIQIRIDDKLKAEADALFADIGLDTSTAIRAFLRQSVICQGLPFPLRREAPNSDTRRAVDDVLHRRHLSKTFSSVEELMEDLDAED